MKSIKIKILFWKQETLAHVEISCSQLALRLHVLFDLIPQKLSKHRFLERDPLWQKITSERTTEFNPNLYLAQSKSSFLFGV